MLRVLLVGLLSTFLGMAQEGGTGVVTGVVVDESTGAPVSSAHLGLGLVTELRTGATTTSDAEGKFRLVGVRAGQYWLECSRAGYVKVDGYSLDGPRVDVPGVGEARPVFLRLIPSGSIEGSLVSEKGEPIGGAQVEAYRSGLKPSTTDREGRFRIDGLPPGEYRLRGRLDDSVRLEHLRTDPATKQRLGLAQIGFYQNSSDASMATPIQVGKGMQLRGIEFRLSSRPLLSVSGIVIDARTGAPLENGEIELRPADSASSGDGVPRRPLRQGAFQFELLSRGSYQVFIYRLAGFGAAPFLTKLDVFGADVADLRIVLPSGGRVSGKVRGPMNSSMTSLSLTPSGSYTPTMTPIGPDGSFVFEGLAPGKWTVGFLGRPADVPLTIASVSQSGQPIGFGVNVVEGDNPPLEIVTAEMFWVTGTVIDQSGSPVEDATIVFQGGRRQFIQSGKDGNYRIGVTAGNFGVSAWHKMPAPGSSTNCPTARVVRVAQNLTGVSVILCP